jgi:hypothetical protein
MARDAGREVRLTGLVNTPAEAKRKRALEAAGIGVLVRPLEPPVPVELVAGIDAIIHLAAAQHEINVPDGHCGKSTETRPGACSPRERPG